MTRQKHLKQLVRTRMSKTGESYATARRQVVAQAPVAPTGADPGPHFPGNIAVTTALRVLLTAAGVRVPGTGSPWSEAMLFGIAGGIGIGVFSFLYEKADFASFFVSGRHLWHDHLAYFTGAARRFGAEVVVKESSGVKPAEKALRELLASHGAAVVWVDGTKLPHRAVPAALEGMSYDVITVYAIDDTAGTASIGDLTDEPITISLEALAAARKRIKKDANRVLALRAPAGPAVPVTRLVQGGLRACHAGLAGEGAPPQARANFSLDALATWAGRLRDVKKKESWAQTFTPGGRLWRGLTSIHEYIELYGTGGGLCRPIFAEFLTEAAAATKQKPLSDLARRYASLGEQWTELANAALPDDVALFRQAKLLQAHKAELATTGGTDSVEERRAAWQQLDALAVKAAENFPLTAADCRKLLDGLADRVESLHAAEVAARDAIAGAVTVS